MDDGSRHGAGLHISVYAFTNEDVDKLIFTLQDKFNMKCSIHYNRDNKPRIYIFKESMDNLIMSLRVKTFIYYFKFPYKSYQNFKQTKNLLFIKSSQESVNLLNMNKSLKKVTHNFKRNATRINCSKVQYLRTDRIYRFPKHFTDYFPGVHIV